MKIKNLEESGIVKSAIICNDIILLMVSYWFAFALTHSFALAFNFPYALKTELLIGALTIFPTFYIAPPVFLKRMVYGNDILGRSVYTVCLQTLFMIAAISLIRRMNVAGEELLMGASFFFCLLYAERTIVHNILKHSRSKGHNQRYVICLLYTSPSPRDCS